MRNQTQLKLPGIKLKFYFSVTTTNLLRIHYFLPCNRDLATLKHTLARSQQNKGTTIWSIVTLRRQVTSLYSPFHLSCRTSSEVLPPVPVLPAVLFLSPPVNPKWNIVIPAEVVLFVSSRRAVSSPPVVSGCLRKTTRPISAVVLPMQLLT